MFLSVLSAFDQKHGVSNHDSHQEFTITVKTLLGLQTESRTIIRLQPVPHGLNLDLTECIFYLLDDLCYYQINVKTNVFCFIAQQPVRWENK